MPHLIIPQITESIIKWTPHFRGGWSLGRLGAGVGIGAFGFPIANVLTQEGSDQAEVMNAENGEEVEVAGITCVDFPGEGHFFHDEETGQWSECNPEAEGVIVESLPDELDDLIAASQVEQPVEISAAHQRVVNNLRDLLKETRVGGTDNPLGLDPAEVEEFANNPDARVFNTFRIWSIPDGDPTVIIATGERPEGAPVQGFTRTENITNVMAALDRIYRMDPNLITILIDDTDNRGLKVITGNILLFSRTGQVAGFTVWQGAVHINENIGFLWGVINLMYIIPAESRHIRTIFNPDFPGRLDPNSGIDKALWVDSFIDIYPNAFTEFEKRFWRVQTAQIIKFYTENPQVGA